MVFATKLLKRERKLKNANRCSMRSMHRIAEICKQFCKLADGTRGQGVFAACPAKAVLLWTELLEELTVPKNAMKNLRQSYYDFFSKYYDRFVSLHSRDPQSALKKFLADMVSMEGGGRVLDICCGTGSFLLELSKRTGPKDLAVGLDFSRGMLMVSREKTGVRSNVCLVQADAAALPFSSRSFDAVTCTHAFYELKGVAQERALREIVRILKPGKVFFMVEHDLPENPFIRTLYYLRLASMGFRRAFLILRQERNTLERYFRTAERIDAPTGRSKILLCRN